MGYFTGLYLLIALMFLIIVTNRFLARWMKIAVSIYLAAVSVLFITITNKINNTYEDIVPVPDAYWAENTQWVFIVSNLLFVPFTMVLIFIYIKWLLKVKTVKAKVFIAISVVPAAVLLFLFYTFFNFAYGYQP